MYKMKGSRKSIRRKIRQLKTKLKRRFTKKSRKNHSRRHNMRGGYSAYMNNVPSGPGMSLGGQLSPSLSALATPPIFQRYDNAIDNLNHNALNSFGNSGAGSGFVSRGSY